jgi:GNAT superfamily N-acetyltransferase
MKPLLAEVCRLLEQDPLRNLVTLKMLTCYLDFMDFKVLREGDDWAVLGLLEVRASAWDRKTYPSCKYAAFVNGNDPARMVQLLNGLPKENIVVKTADDVVREWVIERGSSKAMSLHSFTSEKRPAAEVPSKGIAPSGALNAAARKMFRANGYADDELEQYFRTGAKWFGIECDGRLASACFVFENYKRVWEIAGVYTHPDYRRRRLAMRAVDSALVYLAQCGLLPRYQARSDNDASLNLARSAGLIEFLRMDHYVVEMR